MSPDPTKVDEMLIADYAPTARWMLKVYGVKNVDELTDKQAFDLAAELTGPDLDA